MDKKIAEQLAALYSRHNSLMNLIRALEEYQQGPQAQPEQPVRLESRYRRHRPVTRNPRVAA